MVLLISHVLCQIHTRLGAPVPGFLLRNRVPQQRVPVWNLTSAGNIINQNNTTSSIFYLAEPVEAINSEREVTDDYYNYNNI